MTSTGKWIIAALLVIIALAVWVYMGQRSDDVAPATVITPVATTTDATPAQPVSTAETISPDTSDAGLTDDMTKVDAQMDGLNSDSASADSGLNAK